MIIDTLKLKLESLPNTPGIYKFLDKEGTVLYVGKAINLHSRVNSYFKQPLYDRPRILPMMPLVADIKIQETNNEIEALILESALVRELQPEFNSVLKDDKSYAWIYITTKEKFPTVKIVRSIKKGDFNKGRMFGPYPSGYTVKRVYTYLRKIYPFCTCKNKDCKSSLNYHIGLCPGPYAGAITQEEYRENIDNIIRFLNGKQVNHIKRLEREMNEYSKKEEFEKASQLRDRVKDLKYIGESIDFTYYDDTLSYKNRREKAREKSFGYLELELGVKGLKRIECYDISNMQGKHAYGSMVVAQEGEIKRSEYRIFKIKGKDTPDDFAMLKEVLERRFSNMGKNTDSSLTKKPDIILIDGGVGQLSSVMNSIPKDTLLMGISKGKHLKRKGGSKIDEYWILRDGQIYQIEINSPEILIDLRNEAHRFAISHYRKQSIKESRRSVLDSVVGVGEKRKKALIKNYGSIDALKEASLEDITNIVKNSNVAKRIKERIT
ncbi:MAG: excinuclease ABC subunit UvrC [Candidatus Dojkabacteria bacterium]|jgi:excinuclease ABC subunit C|nr:excinuclease ABC subunit UvrC [Candidatus Dojkabacteria bacterium]